MRKIVANPRQSNGEPRDDEYDSDTVRWYEKIYKDFYFYEIYVLIEGKVARIIVTTDGVSIDFWSGETIHTNIIPNRLFPGKEKLVWDDLHKIIDILESSDLEGKTFSKEEMEAKFEEWKRLFPEQAALAEDEED